MSTISSFLSRIHSFTRLSGVLIICVLLVQGVSACSQTTVERARTSEDQVQLAPDAPRPRPTLEEKPPTVSLDWLQPVELEAVLVHKLDKESAELAGPSFFETSSDPLVIKVYTLEPLDPTPRTSWPVIVLNGAPVQNSRLFGKEGNVLIGFLPDRELIRERNTVEVLWVGNEDLTRTSEPLTFSAEDIDKNK